MNPDLDLTLQRVIRTPRARVWHAWTEPTALERWWLPAPAQCRVDRLEPRPGGALVTSMSEDGASFSSHLDACFLVVEEPERIVFTNAVDSEWRPAGAASLLMTAEVTLLDHPDGTDYRVVVRHGDPSARARHEQLGFEQGWGTVTEQLARLVEREVPA